MTSANVRAFDRLIAASPALQLQLEQIRDPIELITLAKAEGVE